MTYPPGQEASVIDLVSCEVYQRLRGWNLVQCGIDSGGCSCEGPLRGLAASDGRILSGKSHDLPVCILAVACLEWRKDVKDVGSQFSELRGSIWPEAASFSWPCGAACG